MLIDDLNFNLSLPTFTAPTGKVLYQMLVLNAFRPDNLISMTHRFTSVIMGDSFMQQAEQELDLASVVENEVTGFYFLTPQL